jgi:prepilin-type N-terminal cleavage/methylation domain-containing protein
LTHERTQRNPVARGFGVPGCRSAVWPRGGRRLCGRRHGGFSLAELLVVLGIVALLAGLILPVVVSVRRNARDTVCACRLRELSLATNLYLADADTYPEPVHGVIDGSASQTS